MKPKSVVLLAGSVVLSGLVLYTFFSVRSCVREKRWLALGPIENHPVRIYDVKYAREFNDMNDVQLNVAQAIGVPPVKDREEAEKMKDKLVLLEDCDLYEIRELTHSIPYLVPSAKELLDLIGRNFQDSLASHGLNPNKLVITSVLRTEADVAALRKRNTNASENSTHRYGTTFDLSYRRFKYLGGKKASQAQMKYLLGEVVDKLRNRNRCYVRYETKQTCLHITVTP